MELIKKNIHMNQIAFSNNLQITLDNDYNLPDTKPDFDKLIKASGEIVFSDRKLNGTRLGVTGVFKIRILYLSSEPGQPVHSLCTEFPFDEIINIDHECNSDFLKLSYEIEDLSINVLNSRKLSINSLIRFNVTCEEIFDQSIVTGISSEDTFFNLSRNLRLMGISVCRRDMHRVRESITLPTLKGNIAELLYHEVSLKNSETRLLNDKFSLSGELSVFCIYLCDSEEHSLEYIETDLPFNATIECSDLNESMTPDINVSLSNCTVSVKPDADGEERIIEVEAFLDLDIKAFQENDFELIQDVYSPTKDIRPVYKDIEYENFLFKNSNRIRLIDKAKIPSTYPKILQICHGSGTVEIDETSISENGVLVEGIVNLNIFYISVEDTTPLQTFKITIPFSQLIEVKDLNSNCIYNIKPSIEQISLMMLDAQEIEVKAILLLDAVFFSKHNEPLLSELEVSPLEPDVLRRLPYMTGYFVKKGDTLWDIAKMHHSTVSSIKEVNEINADEVAEGECLLIVKEAAL